MVNKLSNYKVFSGNEHGQATRDELGGYIEGGWIGNLGNSKQKNIKHRKFEDGRWQKAELEPFEIGFVSKRAHGVIQNNNLSSGTIFESWFKKPFPDENHFVANGFSNAWYVDVDSICNNGHKCNKNEDGSFDLELIIEFWPQKIFYIGAFISIATFFVSGVWLFFNWKRGGTTKSRDLKSKT